MSEKEKKAKDEAELEKQDSQTEAEEKKEESKAKTEGKSEKDGEKSEKKSEKSEKKQKAKAEKKAVKKDRRSLKARAFKRGWFSIVLVVLFIAAVILVNLISTTLVEKIPALVVDTTGSDNFNLTEDTLEYIPTLDEDITLIVLADEKDFKDGGEYYIQSNTLLHEYANKSDRISLKYVDLASNPTFVNSYPDESLANYAIIVQGENDYRYLTSQDYLDVEMDYNYNYYIAGSNLEEVVTSAILNVTLDDKPKVTFISDVNGEDYSYFKSYLEKNGFETEEISPAMNAIPEDTKFLVLFAPSVDLDTAFVDTVSDFLYNNGDYGKELIYLPARVFTPFPNIDSLIEEWGISVDDGIAVENDTNYIGQAYGYLIYATQYADTTYTANMKKGDLPFCVVGGYARPVDILDSSKAQSLFTFSDQSEVIYIVDSPDEAEEDTITESKPNLNIGAIATKSTTVSSDADTDTDEGSTETKSSNIVVIGSSVSMSETMLESSVYGNSSYIISLFNTLSDRGDVGITIESKSLLNEELGITTAQMNVLYALFVIVIPLGVLITGIVIFIKRRNM